MRRLMILCGACFASAVLMQASCPGPGLPLPQRVDAPVLVMDSAQVTGVRRGGEWRKSIRLPWTAPVDSEGIIASYVLLRSSAGTIDSLFDVAIQGIPDTIRAAYDVIDEIPSPSTGGYQPVYYRLFALDTYGRAGDTCPAESVMLAPDARVLEPADSTYAGQFRWSMTGVQGPYISYIKIWSSAALLWESPRPAMPVYGGEAITDLFSAVLPDSVRSVLAGSRCWYGAKIDVQMGNFPQSIVIGSCVIP